MTPACLLINFTFSFYIFHISHFRIFDSEDFSRAAAATEQKKTK
jgi:hypothetical protein